MPTVTKTFTYSGTLQQATIPAGTTSIDIYLWGGAGGAGGAGGYLSNVNGENSGGNTSAQPSLLVPKSLFPSISIPTCFRDTPVCAIFCNYFLPIKLASIFKSTSLSRPSSNGLVLASISAW